MAVNLSALRTCRWDDECIYKECRRLECDVVWLLLKRTFRRRRNVFPVRYELGLYFSQDGLLHSHLFENLKFYIAFNWLVFVAETECVSSEVQTGLSYTRRRHASYSPPRNLKSSRIMTYWPVQRIDGYILPFSVTHPLGRALNLSHLK
jgi:hypothetical protein